MKRKVPSWTILMVVCMIVAMALGGINAITSGPIQARAEMKANEGRRSAYPTADGFRQIDVVGDAPIDACYEAVVGNDVVGYVVSLTVTGCQGMIEVQAGFDLNGVVQAIDVGGQNFSETPGLGARTKEPEFRDQFIGQSLPLALGENIDSVTGASISSGAVVGAVNTAGEYVKSIAG